MAYGMISGAPPGVPTLQQFTSRRDERSRIVRASSALQLRALPLVLVHPNIGPYAVYWYSRGRSMMGSPAVSIIYFILFVAVLFLVLRSLDSGRLPQAFRVSVDPDTLLALIASQVDMARRSLSIPGYAGMRPLIGRIRVRSFCVWTRRRYRNGFAPVLLGSVDPEPHGASLRARVCISPVARGLLRAWYGSLAVLGMLLVFGHSAANSHSSQSVGWELTIPLAMAVFSWMLVAFGRWLGRSEERVLWAWLRDVVTEAGPDVPPR
jgi:hypothetical protein